MRRIFMLGVAVVAVMALAGCDQVMHRSPYRVTDPTNDQGDAPDEVDIRAFTLKESSGGTYITVKVDVGFAVPFEEWGTAIDSLSINIGSGLERDYDLFVDRNGANLYLGSPAVCPVSRSVRPATNRYIFSFASSCLEGNRPFIVGVQKIRSFHIQGEVADKLPDSGIDHGVIPYGLGLG